MLLCVNGVVPVRLKLSTESSADRRGEGDGWAVGGDVAVHATRSRVGAGNVSAVHESYCDCPVRRRR